MATQSFIKLSLLLLGKFNSALAFLILIKHPLNFLFIYFFKGKHYSLSPPSTLKSTCYLNVHGLKTKSKTHHTQIMFKKKKCQVQFSWSYPKEPQNTWLDCNFKFHSWLVTCKKMLPEPVPRGRIELRDEPGAKQLRWKTKTHNWYQSSIVAGKSTTILPDSKISTHYLPKGGHRHWFLLHGLHRKWKYVRERGFWKAGQIHHPWNENVSFGPVPLIPFRDGEG